jgi:hypothetical protein
MVSALIARQPVTTYQVKIVPSFENVVATDYFPLQIKNTWEYVGTARNVAEQEKVVQKEVRVLMQVMDITRGGNATLFIMKGHPSDAVWAITSEDASQDVVDVPGSTYGYLLIANKVFRIPEDRLGAVRKSIEEGVMPGFIEPGIISQADMDFELPLFRGQVFGSPDQIARNDRSYAWHVTDSTLYHAPDKEMIKEIPCYKLVYLTRSDYTEISFVPYVGIVSFSYSHHGSKAQVDLNLQDYRIHSR